MTKRIIRKLALPALKSSTFDIPPLPGLRDFMNMYRLEPKKVLSQNYLMDMNLTRKIVRKAGDIDDGFVVEIGPGPGGITRALLETPIRRLDVIEIDERFVPPLEVLQSTSGGRMHIHNADVLKAQIEPIWKEAGAEHLAWVDEELPPLHIIGNLPFNIATPLIIKYLRAISLREDAWSFGRVPLTLSFQLEVARRIIGQIDTDDRSRLSIMSQYVTEPKIVMQISGSCFIPPPKVNVGVIRFVPRIEPLIPVPFEVVEKLVRHVFMYRQKHVYRGLRDLYPPSIADELCNDLIKNSRIDRKLISVQLGMEEIGQLCVHYYKQCNDIPGIFAYRHGHKRQDTLEALKDRPNATPPEYGFDAERRINLEGISLCDFDKHYG